MNKHSKTGNYSRQNPGKTNEGLYPEYFARFYDIIYHQVRDGVDNLFYLKNITETAGKILEVGVGTGRLFTEALKQGADIYGIDISQSMLDVLIPKLEPDQQKRVSLQNIIDFRFDTGFDLIIAPFRVFMHLTDKNDQLSALNNVCRNLNPGGRFIFDLFIPDLKMIINGLDNVMDIDTEYEPGCRLKRFVSTKPVLIDQIINLTFRIEWNDLSGDHVKEWRTPLRFFFRFEIEHLLERSEFGKYQINGDFKGNKLDSDSKEFIILCQK
jgi:SAM-dependent methyltransferase